MPPHVAKHYTLGQARILMEAHLANTVATRQEAMATAHTLAALMRQKRLPPLARLLSKLDPKTRGPMSPEKIHSAIMAINHTMGGKTIQLDPAAFQAMKSGGAAPKR